MPTWDHARQPAEFRYELSKLKLSGTSVDLLLAQGGGPKEISAIIRGLKIASRLLSRPKLEAIALTVATYPKLRIMGDTTEHDTEDRQELLKEILEIIGQP